MKNRTVIGVICIALALVLCFGIAPLINNVTDGTIQVVRVKANMKIASGSAISSDKVESVKAKKSDFGDGIYYSYETFNNKYLDSSSTDYIGAAYATGELTAGEYISQTKVSNNISSGSALEGLEPGQMAMSIAIDSFASGLSGKLENGDIVSLVVFTSDQGGTIPVEFKYVKVITTTTASGVDKSADNKTINSKSDSASTADSTYEAPATVTLLVNEQQAKVLSTYSNKGKITVALRCRAANKSLAVQYLEEQSATLNSNVGG